MFQIHPMRTFKIIEKLGGRRATANVVTAQLRPVTTDTVRMWCQRGRIPGDVVRCLLKEAEARKIDTAGSDFDVFDKQRSAA